MRRRAACVLSSAPLGNPPEGGLEVPEMASATLCELLNDSARRWPDRVAVGTAGGDRMATYRDLDALSRDLAGKLHGLGIGRSDTVAIFSDNGACVVAISRPT